ITIIGNTFTNSVPPQSVTLYVLPTLVASPAAPRLRAGTLNSSNTFDLWLDGQTAQRYILLSSAELLTWNPIATNTLTSNSWHLFLPATNGPRTFYRAKWEP